MLLKNLRSSTILGLCLTTATLPTAQAQGLDGIDLLGDQKDALVWLLQEGTTPECIEEATAETDVELDWSKMKAEFFTQGNDGTCTLDEQAMAEAGIEGFAPESNETADQDVSEEPDAESVETVESDTPDEEVVEQAESEADTEVAVEAEISEDSEIEAEIEAETEADATVTEDAEGQEETDAETVVEEAIPDAPEVETQAEADADTEPTVETSEAEESAEPEPAIVFEEVADDAEVTQPEESAAASASTDISEEQTADASVEVETETVTEETSRSSSEDVKVREDDNDNDRRNRLLTILGTAAAGAVAGAILNDGNEVVEDTGDRVIVRRNGQLEVRKDENEILRRPGSNVTTQSYADGSTRTVVERPNGVRVLTIRDQYGYTIYRSRILTNGEEIVLFDDRRREEEIEEIDMPVVDATRFDDTAINYSTADIDVLIEALKAQEMAELDRRYSLRQVRENDRLRDVIPSIDLDVVNFATGSAAITRNDARALDALGRAMATIIDDNPREVFLIEGHTDAVGSETYNLALSDRRAESVALALTEYYDVPPENLIVQGYGERDLKIETQDAERRNRRATVRRITPLLENARLN